jgi:hypothetical protein
MMKNNLLLATATITSRRIAVFIVNWNIEFHERISAFSVWTRCGLLSPQSLANFAEIRFRSAISLDEFLHNAMCELTVNCVLT